MKEQNIPDISENKNFINGRFIFKPVKNITPRPQEMSQTIK
jgi:hypothetical protein